MADLQEQNLACIFDVPPVHGEQQLTKNISSLQNHYQAVLPFLQSASCHLYAHKDAQYKELFNEY